MTMDSIKTKTKLIIRDHVVGVVGTPKQYRKVTNFPFPFTSNSACKQRCTNGYNRLSSCGSV